MSKIYQVINVDDMAEYGVTLGDTCILMEEFSDSRTSAWFYSPNWIADGVWVLDWVQLEEIVETN